MVKLEKSTVHVYLAPFLGVHAQIQWSKFHDTRLIGCTRLLGTPEQLQSLFSYCIMTIFECFHELRQRKKVLLSSLYTLINYHRCHMPAPFACLRRVQTAPKRAIFALIIQCHRSNPSDDRMPAFYINKSSALVCLFVPTRPMIG